MNKEEVLELITPKYFFSSGSTLLDLAISQSGEGWAIGRISNVVGDRSTGKTLVGIEAFANFKRAFPQGVMRYAEAEAAFDESFAEQLGFPKDVEKPEEQLHTVEEFRDDLHRFVKDLNGNFGLYILDSLDALSDAAEVKAFHDGETDKGSFGAAKAKQSSKFFRLLAQTINKTNCHLMIISQVRDNIGVTFGESNSRSGGRSLDFYASQVVWLADTGKITRTVRSVTRPIGVKIKAKCKKNKVGLPFREAEWPLIFGYGIDDEQSMIDWLKTIKILSDEEHKKSKAALERARDKQEYKVLAEITSKLKVDVRKLWNDIEDDLRPSVQKYRTVEA